MNTHKKIKLRTLPPKTARDTKFPLLAGASKDEKPLHGMVLGVLTLHIWIDESHSLKEKRHVVQSLVGRIRARWNVSAAQLDDHDRWNVSELGVAVVSNDRVVAERVLNHIRDFVDADTRCDLGACSLEII